MHKLNLYTTLGCHLCDEAHRLLIEAQSQGFEFEVCEVEISDSELLMRDYGVRIPVIKFDDEQGATAELGWPFTLGELQGYLHDYLHTTD